MIVPESTFCPLACICPAQPGCGRRDGGDYADEIARSGFPAIRQFDGRLLRAQLDGYLDRIVERDFEELGQVVRNVGALRRWLTAFGAATSTVASYDVIRDAASAGEAQKPTKRRRSRTVPRSNASG